MAADRQSVEIAWFGALCDDDYEFLGVADEDLESSWLHCSDIVRRNRNWDQNRARNV